MYGFNRFLACRFGLEADFIDARTREKGPLKTDLLRTLATVRNYSSDDSGREAIDWLRGTVEQGASGSAWLREEYRRHRTLSDVVRRQCELWSTSLDNS